LVIFWATGNDTALKLRTGLQKSAEVGAKWGIGRGNSKSLESWHYGARSPDLC